jgi:hypothetical protein
MKNDMRGEEARRNGWQFPRTYSGCEHSFTFVTRSGALTRLSLATLFHSFGLTSALLLVLLITCASTLAQNPSYPKEIRGYKVERTVVELKKPANRPANDKNESESDVDQLIQFGQPRLVGVTPLGITFEVPLVMAPIKQSGHVEFLLFEDMVVNGKPVDIDEYHRAFDLPNKEPLTLREPLSIYISLPSALLTAMDEWSQSKETWPVTGRIYVFGSFKKSIFSFKRCVPVELNLTMRNPLRQ